MTKLDRATRTAGSVSDLKRGLRVVAGAVCALVAVGASGCGAASREVAERAAPPAGGVARVDRTVPPQPGPPPEFRLPALQRHRLSNGLSVTIVEQHELPVVDLRLVVRTGAAADGPQVAGRASLTADLLDEGTTTRSALELADAIDFLGAELTTYAGWDASIVSMHVLTPRLEPALELMADVVLNPSFPEDEFERKKRERLTALLQEQDEPRVLAAKAFAAAVYGPEHPFGTTVQGTRESVERLDRQAVVDFYRTYYRPNNAFLVVVGDVTPATLLPLLERVFGSWQPADVPPVRLPAPPAAQPTAVYLVDKPGAAQSELRMGHVGVARDTPDYFSLVVLNTILGGSFTSRLNTKLREEKGYSYGAGSAFDLRRAPGPFLAGTAVFTDVTDSAVVIVLDEIRRIREEPVPAAELERAKNYLALGFPGRFERTDGIAGQIVELELYGLDDAQVNRYVERIRAVTAEDVQRVARQYLDPDHMVIAVAGDRAKIEERLRAAGIGPVQTVEVR